MTFYMTYARSRPDELVPWAEEHDVPLLTNAIHRWSDHTNRFLDMWEYDTRHTIDAGGYNVQSRYADLHGNLTAEKSDVKAELESDHPFYPYSLTEYHRWLLDHQDEFEWATVMDYACEDRFEELWSVSERVEKTLEHTIDHFNKNPDYKVLPVLQGRSVDDYVEFYNRLEDHGIPCDHVGLGTVCRLSGEKKIVEYENKIRQRTGVDKIHGFGVKIEAYKQGANFDSADSQAWAKAPSNGFMYVDERTRLGRVDMPKDSLKRTVGSFKHYYVYVKRLMGEPTGINLSRENVAMQQTLPDYA